MNHHDHSSIRRSALGPSGPVPVPAELRTGALSARAGLRGANSGSHRGHVARAGRTPTPQADPVRTYVLDTSVLLADPAAIGRFEEHEVVLPVVVITELEAKRDHPELGFFARAALRQLDELRVVHGRLDHPVPVGDLGGTLRVELNHTDPALAAVGLPPRRQRHPHPRGRPQPRQRGRPGHAGLQGPPAADQGLGRRARRRGVPRRARPAVRLDRHGRARRRRRRPRRPVRRGAARPRGGPRAALPHRAGDAVRAGQRPRPGPARQERPAGPRRPGGVRAARPLRGAAGRPRPAARPRGRHRLARRPRRHRQVGAGAVRRAGGRDGAPPAQEGRGLPAALRRRRPGARLPARVGERQDVALGAGGLRHPRRADVART